MILGKFVGFVVFINSLIANGVAALSARDVELCKGAHNALRDLHEDTPPLTWDDSIAEKAQQYAEELARLNQNSLKPVLIHDKKDQNLGENLFWAANSVPRTCIIASLKWYSEIDNYNYFNQSAINGKPIGHFTQLVWKNSIKFGVGIATFKSVKYAKFNLIETIIVAKYSPRGNMNYSGERNKAYIENVKPRKPGVKTPTESELNVFSFRKDELSFR